MPGRLAVDSLLVNHVDEAGYEVCCVGVLVGDETEVPPSVGGLVGLNYAVDDLSELLEVFFECIERSDWV